MARFIDQVDGSLAYHVFAKPEVSLQDETTGIYQRWRTKGESFVQIADKFVMDGIQVYQNVRVDALWAGNNIKIAGEHVGIGAHEQ